MLACMRTAAVFGIDACTVNVEVDVSFGLPGFTMVGLPDASVRESRDRVRSAIRNSGFDFPHNRVTVNLAPADIRKAGASFDLPIALGVLAATGCVTRRDVDDVLLLGELSLDGGIHPTRGVLPIAAAARRERFTALLLPRPNRAEASVVEGLHLYPVRSLAEAVAALNDPAGFRESAGADAAAPAAAAQPGPGTPISRTSTGRRSARRALEIAAAGGHNTLMVGPPGIGQDDDGATGRGNPAAARLRRGARGHVDPLRRRPAAGRHGLIAAAAVSRAAPHHLGRRARRRRAAPAARRDQPRAPRRALSRRDAGVQPPRARGAAAAARGRVGAHRARRADRVASRRGSC